MERRWKHIGTVIALVIVMVAVFQTLWPAIYPSIVALNRYPTDEYLRIMWLLSPNGISALTIAAGCVLIAWIAYVEG